MRGKIFDNFMMFIGYILPIFIITLAGVIFILTSIFKYYHINNPSQFSVSIQSLNNQNNQSYPDTINSTIMVDIYYQNGYDVYYVPSFIENLSNWNIYYYITNSYTANESSDNSIFEIDPGFINNTNSTTFSVTSLENVYLNTTISLLNFTNGGNNVTYTYDGNTYECGIVGSSDVIYPAGSFVYFCILCQAPNSQNIQNFYLSEPEYLNITPAISLLGNFSPTTQYYDYTVNNVEIVNGTYVVITLSAPGYSMEDFQNVLVTIGPPLSNYINTTPYYGDNVVFLVNYDGKYYALPSWYAGESNGNYYFFINLLNLPSFYNSNNFGCSFLPIFVGFSNENLLPYLNGTIGGAPEALYPNDPYSAVEYDNGLNVFPIYVNFYSYPGSGGSSRIEDNENCGNSYGFPTCYQNILYDNVLPPYNNVTIYVNGTGITPNVETNGPFEGLVMDNDGTWQGSYILINSTVLFNTFYNLAQSSNGLGLQTFVYFSGVPCEDPVGTGGNPLVADAVVLSYVGYNSQFYADTISDYNNNDSSNQQCYPNYDTGTPTCYNTGNTNIGIYVGGNTYLPSGFPIFMYEYGWDPNFSPGPGYSSGYYVGILEYNDSIGYFLTTQYTNNLNPNLNEYYDYYYSGSAESGSNYYFVEDNNNNGKNIIQGYNGGSQYFPFMPPDQQQNQIYDQPYSQYGLFWLYNWFQADSSNNMMNIYFLMNGNIFDQSLASVYDDDLRQYVIPPNPPANTINGEPIFAQSYINAYNTAFNQPDNSQRALYNYQYFNPSDVNSNNFIPGTFGYQEQYNSQGSSLGNSITISYLQDNAQVYSGAPCLFISAGSRGGTSYMYLDWVIVTYGVPYVVSVS